MQQFTGIRRFMEQPLMTVLGMLTGAGAAKSGHGGWAAGGIAALISVYVGTVLTSMATRSLGLVEEHDPHVNPLGVKGVGETAIVGVAPAIANAVFHATGKRIRELPITPDKLL